MVNMAVALDDPLQQETLFRSAIAAYRSCDGRYALGLALHNLAETIRSVRGAYEEASTLLEEAVAVERSIALSHRLPWWLTARAEVLLDGGGLNEAEHDLMEAARFLAALQSGWGAWEAEHVAFVRGRLLLDRGDAVRASEVFRRIAVGESGRADPHGYRLKALCWRVLAAWRAEQWHLGETLARKARQALRDPSWTRMSSELALAPDGALVGGVLVEAHVRRGDVDAASGVLAEWVAILRRAPLLPAALHLGLAGARLGALAAKEGTEEQFLAMVATHTASAAHTRAEARRRLGALGSPRLHGPIDGDTRTGAPRVEDVLMALEALI